MAHMLEQLADGTYSFAYVGEHPWHGLGQNLSDLAPEDRSFRVFLDSIGGDRPIETCQMFTPEGVPVEGKVLVRRVDDKAQFTIASPDWTITQDTDAIALFDEFVSQGHLAPETLGRINNGSELFATARCPKGHFTLPGGDTVFPYLNFHSPHVYGKAASLFTSTVRQVCNNTVRAALSKDGRKGMRISHKEGLYGQNRTTASEMIAKAVGEFDKFREAAEHLANTRIDRATTEQMIAQVYQPELLTPDRLADATPLRADFGELAANVLVSLEIAPGANLLSAKGTAWGLLNAVTYVEDHLSLAKTDEGKVVAAQFGRGNDRKNAMLDNLLRFAA